MPMQIIPIPSDNAQFSLTVDLDDVVYLLTFTFNTRCQAWYMDVALQNGTPLLCGRKIIPGVDLTGQHKDPRLPKGRIFALADKDSEVRMTRSELGGRVNIWYVDEETLEQVTEILNAPVSA